MASIQAEVRRRQSTRVALVAASSARAVTGAPPRPAVEMRFPRPPPPGSVVAAPPLLAGNALETVRSAAQAGPEVGPSDSRGHDRLVPATVEGIHDAR
jgi:hypothetical protein